MQGIGKIVVLILTTFPIVHCELHSPHLRRVELVNVGTFCRWVAAGVENCLTGRRPVHRDRRQKLVFGVSGSLRVNGEAEPRASNDL